MNTDATNYTTKVNNDKYKNAILYFLKYCNNNYLGKTKLNKLLYYLDFISYRDRKKLITDDKYFHLDYGPVPQNIDEVLVNLKAEGLIEAQDIPFKEGHKKEFKALKDPNLGVFNKYEKQLLESICKEFELWQTQKIVDQTHLESPWLYSEPYGPVDYELASDIDLFPELINAAA